MRLVVDESVGRVHFAAGVAVGALERVLAFERRAAAIVANNAMYSSRHFGGLQPGQEAELARIYGSAIVRCHVHCWITLLRDVVLCYWQSVRLGSNLDVAIGILSSNCGRAHARVDA